MPELLPILLPLNALTDLLAVGGAVALAPDPPGGLLSGFIADFGPWAMIVLLLASGFGIPIGEEVVNIPAGIFVGRGEMRAVPTYLAAYFGVLGGDFIWFFLCRSLGKSLLHRKWFKRLAHPRRLLQVKHQFDRQGAWVLVIARFIPGTRTPALTIAGILHMPWRNFAIIEFSLCAVTTALQVTIGVLIGHQLAGQSLQTTIYSALATIAVILALSGLTTWAINARRKRGPMPRERAAWLKRFRRNRTVASRQ